MQPARILIGKVTTIRKKYIEGEFNATHLAAKLHIARSTIWKYKLEFDKIKAAYPDKLEDYSFFMPKASGRRQTPMLLELKPLIPKLFKEANTDNPDLKSLWMKYRKLCPNGYQYVHFKILFQEWMSVNVPRKPKQNLIQSIPKSDLKIINKWRHSILHKEWQIAVTLTWALEGYTVMQIMDKTDAMRKTIDNWIATYKTKGLKGFERKPLETNIKVVKRINERKENLIKLLHETPKLYGINRTSWSITALTQVYTRLYNDNATYHTISYCLKQLGYKRKKSRDMLTSQDPKFREKINKIQQILQKLGPKDKFFSIDEYGPVGVRLRGGSVLKLPSEPANIIPQNQKHKGIVLCTAALELSTNQITHFYSRKKNTFETIKLIDVLLEKYNDQERLYLCWDAATWHSSKILLTYLKDINSKDYRDLHHTPEVKLAPLPTCSQFLNVIESVFAGLAKAVIHNSDYPSLAHAKEAIDLHFEVRNKHYLENPKHAGKKIWGKELVVPQFSETQQCKVVSALQGRYSKSVSQPK